MYFKQTIKGREEKELIKEDTFHEQLELINTRQTIK